MLIITGIGLMIMVFGGIGMAGAIGKSGQVTTADEYNAVQQEIQGSSYVMYFGIFLMSIGMFI